MPQVVEVPGMGDVEFPDGMSDEDIAAAIKKNLASAAPPAPTGPQPTAEELGRAAYAASVAQGQGQMLTDRANSSLDAGNNVLGIQPDANRGVAANLLGGPLEAAASAASSAALAPVAGLAGLGQGAWNSIVPKSMEGMPAADRVRQVQGLAYEPRTAVGQGMLNVGTAPLQAYGKATNYLGEKTADITGSPAAGALVKTLGDFAPGAGSARGLLTRAEKPKGEFVSRKNEVPTTEELTAASKQAYKAGKESGVIVPAEGYAQSLGKVRDMVKAEGINSTLHPKSTAVMKVLEESAGKDLTLQEAETLRKIALDAEDDLNPVTRGPTPDARLAGKIVDELDDSVDALSTNSPARALWSRSRRSQMIDQLVHRAEIKAGAHYTQAGMEHALRGEFKQLALNPRRMRGLTAEQRAAIEKVAKGGPVENTLRTIGKFDPTTSVVAAAGSIGTSALMSPLTGGASALLPLAGFVGKRLATAATARNVGKARESLVGRGLLQRPTTLDLSRSAAVTGELMPRAPLALPAPNIISGQRTAPGTAYAREQMGITPDVERAGLLHPGMARTQVPRPPLALPYLPDKAAVQSAMVVDPAGRVAASGAQLQDYLRSTGQQGLGGVRQPAANPQPGLLADKTVSAPQGLLSKTTRSMKEIREDVRRLEAKLRNLSPADQHDSLRMQALSQEWARLQAELKQRAPRAALP